MKTLAGNLETLNKEALKQMSDVAQAQHLISAIGGGGSNATALLGKAEEKLQKLFPKGGWTYRRLRAWWNNETEIVRHWQMMQLYEAASVVKSEAELLREARKQYADFKQKTARLATFIEHQDEAFHGPQVDALRGRLRSMDLPGNRGE